MLALRTTSYSKRILLKGIRYCSNNSDSSDLFKKFLFKIEGFNKYGLLKDDLIPCYDTITTEAVRRMPMEMQMQRKYREIRAIQCDIENTVLPKEQWSKFEDDHDYLRPYVKEVTDEINEMKEWDSKY